MSDLISRQEAIDALKGLPTWWADEGGCYGGAQPPMVALLDPEDAVSAIENLPSEQPEIIRCKDCTHRDMKNGFCEGRGWPMQLVPDDGFCDKGERKDDE